jgi:hypothetical protein
MDVIDRDTAFMEGLTRYFTGKPCSRNHLSERYVSTGGCIECLHPGAGGKRVKRSYVLHPDDAVTIDATVEALRQARAVETPPVIPKRLPGQLAPREERERNHLRQLRKHGVPWYPMPPAPGDPDYTGPEPVDAIQATLNRGGL